jgi:hypothetical protein
MLSKNMIGKNNTLIQQSHEPECMYAAQNKELAPDSLKSSIAFRSALAELDASRTGPISPGAV